MENKVSTSNAEKFGEDSRDYTNFTALFLKAKKCGEWVLYAERVTYRPILLCSRE